MAHIEMSNDLPGIAGLLKMFPATGRPLSLLAETLLRGPSPLTPAEREAIATHVSAQNNCYFCSHSHAAAACNLPGADKSVIDDLLAKRQPVLLDGRLVVLLEIAEKVRTDARSVTTHDIERARDLGWNDVAIHDTVLIAAAFCMFNRYVDGLATTQPQDGDVYASIGMKLANEGYVNPVA